MYHFSNIFCLTQYLKTFNFFLLLGGGKDGPVERGMKQHENPVMILAEMWIY